MKHVLTIDIGTTSAKILLVSQDGDVVASEQEFYPTQFSHHGWAEQDAALILAAIKRLVSDLVAKHSGKVSVISLSCAMHSIMAVDEKGKPLSHLIIWSDMRSAAIAKQIRSTPRAAALLDVTGTPVHPMSPICKLLWIRENDPDLFKRAFKFISIKEFLIWHLTGQWMVDYSVASSSGLFDIRKLAWSDDALSLAGIGVEKLSRCVSPYHRIPLKSEVAKGFGFANNLVVVAGASDGCLAHLGSNATSPGDVSLTIGTSGAVRKLSAVASGDRQGRLFNYRMDETTFITGGATNNGTVVIDWFRKNFCRSADGSLQDFVNETKQISPGSEGLIFLPFVLGERSPYYDPDLRGVFFGLAQHHSLQHMMRSLLEGVCFEMRSLVDAVSETVGPVDRVLASGGFIRSADWIQMLSNVLGREVLVSDVNDASSMGAAMVGFQSLGVKYNRQQDDCGHRFIPEPSSSEIYNLMYPLFTKLVHKLTDEFEEVARLQQRTLFRM